MGYADRPIPDASDGPVEALLSAYSAATDEVGGVPELTVSQDLARVLVVFAERMATIALRTRDDEPLRRGLLALGLAVGRDEEREILVVLPLLRHSAERHGVELEGIYQEARGHLPPDARSFLDGLIGHDGQRPGISEMGYEVRNDPEGPRYVRTW